MLWASCTIQVFQCHTASGRKLKWVAIKSKIGFRQIENLHRNQLHKVNSSQFRYVAQKSTVHLRKSRMKRFYMKQIMTWKSIMSRLKCWKWWKRQMVSCQISKAISCLYQNYQKYSLRLNKLMIKISWLLCWINIKSD